MTREQVCEQVASFGSLGDYAALDAIGRTLNDAYELARVVTVAQDREERDRRETCTPAWRDPLLSGDPDSALVDYAKEQ